MPKHVAQSSDPRALWHCVSSTNLIVALARGWMTKIFALLITFWNYALNHICLRQN